MSYHIIKIDILIIKTLKNSYKHEKLMCQLLEQHEKL